MEGEKFTPPLEQKSNPQEKGHEVGGAKKQEPISVTRRDFVKAAIGIGAALGLGYNFKDEIGNLLKGREGEYDYEVVISKDVTEFYKNVKDLPSKKIKPADLKESKNLVDRLYFNEAEFIKNSKKGSSDELATKLAGGGYDSILLSEFQGAESNEINAVGLLNSFKNKNNKTITKLGLQNLLFDDKKVLDQTNKFNNKEVSPEDFYNNSLSSKDRELPLLKFAQDNNIKIEGLEDTVTNNADSLKRSSAMSRRMVEIMKDKKSNEMVLGYAGASHITKENLAASFTGEQNSKEFIQGVEEENNTFKESLKNNSYNPGIIELRDLGYIAKLSDREELSSRYERLPDKDAGEFYNHCIKEFKNFKSSETKSFYAAGQERNTDYLVNPSEVPEIPPLLGFLGTIRNEHPVLWDMMNKEGVYRGTDRSDSKLWKVIFAKHASNGVTIAEIDVQSGKIKKLFLPEQPKK